MFKAMGSDSNRWVALIFGLIMISFFVSCKSQKSQDAVISLADNLQIDGYGHVDDTMTVDVSDEPLTCDIIDQEPADHICSDGNVWLCHVPPGNPLNAHMKQVAISDLPGNDGEYTVPCSDEYQDGQNCPLLDCYESDGEGDDDNLPDESQCISRDGDICEIYLVDQQTCESPAEGYECRIIRGKYYLVIEGLGN